ncbi:hypothetical protein, partial [Neisseria meningitidis]|uniref:hypothetical protein n=1 Tax=Neisseria meningitidis TaxID=487 RepID=UPI001C9149D4
SRLRGNDGGKILFFPIIAHNLKFLHSLKNKIRTLNPIIPIYVNIKILKRGLARLCGACVIVD